LKQVNNTDQAIETFIGFDSAWTDNEKAPGAICALQLRPGLAPVYHEPRLVRFAEALAFAESVASGSDYTLIGLDQPTVVPNISSMRPVERVAASVISWIGGGVQPANRSKTGMFCDASPVWPFIKKLGAIQDPLSARSATSGRHLIEVFPALALASLEPAFFRRLGAAKYNPANARRFRLDDWRMVCTAAGSWFERNGLTEPASWCRAYRSMPAPRKADQDRLDAVLCLIVALQWRLHGSDQSIMIGDVLTGYMVTPASAEVRQRLVAAARLRGVAVDGSMLHCG
jgi:predicted RNase H-like nuclease